MRTAWISLQKFVCVGFILLWILTGCGPMLVEPSAGEASSTPRWITFQLQQVRVLADRSDGLDGKAEFRVYTIITDGTSAVQFVYPPEGVVPVSVGDSVFMGKFAPSVDEQAVGDQLVAYVVAVDLDEQSPDAEIATDTVLELLTGALMAVATKGASVPVQLLAETGASTATGKLADWAREIDVIGEDSITLNRSSGWSVGREITHRAADNGIEIVYQVHKGDRVSDSGAVGLQSPSPQLTSVPSPTRQSAETPQLARQTSGVPSANLQPTETAFAPAQGQAVAGDKIAFATNRDGEPSILIVGANGAALQKVVCNWANEVREPSWSPDGTYLAFEAQTTEGYDIYIMRSDGTGILRLTSHAADDRDPDWSPNGQYIAFESNRDKNEKGKDNWEVYVVGADGSNLRRLTDASRTDWDPDWSPDGNRIAFASNRDGNYEIYVMNANGSEQMRLTSSEGKDRDPAWSPDGRRIAFVSDQVGNYELYVMGAGGGNLMRLTQTSAEEWNPTWSPRGDEIAYELVTGGQDWEVWILSADGAQTRNLTTHAAKDVDPAWLW